MIDKLGSVPPQRRSGAERFVDRGVDLGFNLLGFWQWSASDLVANTSRGVLAEYLVARALGTDVGGARDEWAPYDLESPDGLKIEVKSAAYLQSWHQDRPTAVTFRVPKTRAWNPKTGYTEGDSKRQADVYVFALLAHQEKATLNPLDVGQWEFYVLSTRTLDRHARDQRSISLAGVRRLGGTAVAFRDLAQALHAANEAPALNGGRNEAGA